MAADAKRDFADRVPADTCLAVFSDDVGGTCDAFQKTGLGQSLCGADFAPLIKELDRLDLASPLRMRPVFGFNWNDLATVREPGGLVIFPLEDGSLGAAWLFTPAKPVGQLPACLVAATNYFKQKGYRESTVDRAIARLTVLHPPEKRKTDWARVLFVANEFYGVANSPQAADAFLNVKAEQSLATQAAYKSQVLASAGENPSTSDARFCIRPLELQELVERSQPPADDKQKPGDRKGSTKTDSERTKEDLRARAHRLGWDALRFVAGRISFSAAAPCQWQIEAAVDAPGPYRGAMRLLELKPGPFSNLPPWLPADVVSVATWRWNVPQAMKGFGSLYDEANEPGPDGEGMFEDMLDGLRDDPEGVQVDLRRDLFDRLEPDMLRIAAEGKSDASHKRNSWRWLYVASVRDLEAVKGALVRFYKDDKKVTHVKTDHFDVWTVEEGASLFVEGESDSLVTVRALALGEGRLFFSTDVDLLDSAIHPQGDAPHLKDDVAWTRVLEWIKGQENDKAAFRSLTRLDRVMAPSYRLATSDKPVDSDNLGARLWRLLLYGNIKSVADLPHAKAPAFDSLRSALPPSGIVVARSADGWTVRFGALRPGSSQSP
jgi:hypothetical protein